MVAIGDRVRLMRVSCGYGPGAEGIVMIIPQPGVLQVNIDKDSNGQSIQPPNPWCI